MYESNMITERHTAVAFVRIVSAVVVAVTDEACWDTAPRVSTLELIVVACCEHTQTQIFFTTYCTLTLHVRLYSVRAYRGFFGRSYFYQ